MWEPPTNQTTSQPTNYNVLRHLDLEEEGENGQQGALSIIIVGFLFQTPMPAVDADFQPLHQFENYDMDMKIALALRQNRAYWLDQFSDDEDKLDVRYGREIGTQDVQIAFDYLKTHPWEHGNPFYRWQQVHRIWRDGGRQCDECWAEKEKVETIFWMTLGLNALRKPELDIA